MAKRRALVELIETVVLSRLPALGRKELEQMLQLTDVRKSKVFAEGVEKGMEKVAARMLAKGKTVAEIADLTGLAAARIKRIKKKQS
jgi:predicted transposase YdaD